ncbi:hypothetical protein Cs7R123_15520 [Catellatospora sp. TT07R-123]|uniref:acyl-CoA dehydrogenase family protein n=1 Tax=Catellatospora sp. TT07R-123 TaxID=2733863 RepID=UPI001AFCF788|nr:acyl-CoA dehydrogenase family protein [Catellatospora sp. TT07R-123]GHJ44210.1 hypothetical protein Cs7R123_15520 [Catellatospora sp. TT07R-123]
MTTTHDAPAQSVAPPEPDLTPADLIARAEALSALLVERQAETEQRSFYSEQTHKEFAQAGFYRIMVPRRYGGYEFGLDTFLKVTMILARGCASTAWMYCLGAAHSLIAATVFEERAQREIFAEGDFIAPMPIAPTGTARRTPEGDWEINGTWAYCSGAPYASHLIAHALVMGEDGEPPYPLLFVAPRSQWKMLEDWGDMLGLKGSGSHTVTIENGRIPGYCAIEGVHVSTVDVTGGTPGLALHGNPMYGGAPTSSMAMEGAALAVGMAGNALAAYEEVLRTKTTMAPPFAPRMQDPDYQRWYGMALTKIAAAEAITMNAIHQWQELCAQGPASFTPDRDLLLAMICGEAADLSWFAVENIIHSTAGSGAARTGERLERAWRDLSTGHTHAGFAVVLKSAIPRALAQLRFGVPPMVSTH